MLLTHVKIAEYGDIWFPSAYNIDPLLYIFVDNTYTSAQNSTYISIKYSQLRVGIVSAIENQVIRLLTLRGVSYGKPETVQQSRV